MTKPTAAAYKVLRDIMRIRICLSIVRHLQVFTATDNLSAALANRSFSYFTPVGVHRKPTSMYGFVTPSGWGLTGFDLSTAR